jgi:hypothetical protein
MNDREISTQFISLLRQAGERNGFSCELWYGGLGRISRNILKISGSVNCLIYFKIRSARPYKWGVTANRLLELERSNQKYYIILLYESPHTGYFLTSEDVNRYLSIWPLVSDGDYKPAAGSYLQFNEPFLSFSELLGYLIVRK